MVSVMSLWLPILLAAILVFVASSIIHMFLPYHWSDWSAIPDEDRIMDSLRDSGIGPGNYTVPHAGSMEAMQSEEYKAKMERGPAALITVMPSGQGMAKQMVVWFLYSVVVGIFAAYIAGRALGPGAEYLAVFRFTGATALVAYAVGGWQESIWWGRSWSMTIKNTVDGIIYALLTAGAFGWLWPAM